MRESRIQKEALLALSQTFHPGIFWRQNAGRVQTAAGHWIDLGPEGIADICGFVCTSVGALMVFVEVKRKTGKQRKSQIAFQAAAEKAGAVYVVARSKEEAVFKVKDAVGARMSAHERLAWLVTLNEVA